MKNNLGHEKVKELMSYESVNAFDTADLVKEFENCEYASVQSDGNIWIEHPQTGYWLSDCRLSQFVDWVNSR